MSVELKPPNNRKPVDEERISITCPAARAVHDTNEITVEQAPKWYTPVTVVARGWSA